MRCQPPHAQSKAPRGNCLVLIRARSEPGAPQPSTFSSLIVLAGCRRTLFLVGHIDDGMATLLVQRMLFLEAEDPGSRSHQRPQH